MKGFKDENKIFHPIRDTKGVRKSRDQSAKQEGVRIRKKKEKFETRTYKVWKYDDAPEEVQEKILENWREHHSGQDEWFTQDDFLLDGGDTKGNAIFRWKDLYYDLDRGQYIQFNDLQVKNEDEFYKLLGIPKKLQNKISYSFDNPRGSYGFEHNTEIEFREPLGDTLAKDGTYEDYMKYVNDEDKNDALTRNEFEVLQKAMEKFSDMVHNAWVHLKGNYEMEFEKDYIIDQINANDYSFTEDGKID